MKCVAKTARVLNMLVQANSKPKKRGRPESLRSMRDVRATQNLVPKARTKKELAQRKADEEQLAAIRKRYHDYGHEWRVEHAYRVEAYMKYGNAKIARLERLLCDAGGEW